MFDAAIAPEAIKKAKRATARKCDVCTKRIGNKGGLFMTCNGCRVAGCKHADTHYDSALNKVCDDCGTVLKRAKQFGVGNRVPDADMEVIVAMLAAGKSLRVINRKTKIPEDTILKVKNGTYVAKKNIVGASC